MRVPYVVGRWVRDSNHYGRDRLFTYLLNTQDTAIWVVGTRRIGKTSFLRQLEFLAANQRSKEIPLFWDMQGCANSGDLSDELYIALETVQERFAALGIDVTEFEGQDAVVILRRLGRQLAASGHELLLLIDEAEILIEVARQEPMWLARLRKALQGSEGSKTVMASTKLLAQLNDMTLDWNTSPFLLGFNMVNLWSLDPESAAALVEQRQAEPTISVAPTVLEDILRHTNCHPYLLQFLCARLFGEDDQGRPSLHAPTDEDLEPDHLLAGFFLIDFQHLTRLERQILLMVAEHTLIFEDEILAALPDHPPTRVRSFLWGMHKLGHLRQIFGQWAVGNEFLRRWLQQEWERLKQIDTAALDEASFEDLLTVGVDQEMRAFMSEVRQLKANYDALLEQRNSAPNGSSAAVAQELERMQRHLAAAQRDLEITQKLQRSKP